MPEGPPERIGEPKAKAKGGQARAVRSFPEKRTQYAPAAGSSVAALRGRRSRSGAARRLRRIFRTSRKRRRAKRSPERGTRPETEYTVVRQAMEGGKSRTGSCGSVSECRGTGQPHVPPFAPLPRPWGRRSRRASSRSTDRGQARNGTEIRTHATVTARARRQVKRYAGNIPAVCVTGRGCGEGRVRSGAGGKQATYTWSPA